MVYKAIAQKKKGAGLGLWCLSPLNNIWYILYIQTFLSLYFEEMREEPL
jgi:hypothetical protein